MLKTFGHILSSGFVRKLFKGKAEKPTHIDSCPEIPITISAIDSWLQDMEEFPTSKRLRTVINLPSTDIGDVTLYLATIRRRIYSMGAGRYIKSIPPWCDYEPSIKTVDEYFVKDDYYVEIKTVLLEIKETITDIHTRLNSGAVGATMVDYYNTRIRRVCRELESLLTQLH